jgi:hypothetical protein
VSGHFCPLEKLDTFLFMKATSSQDNTVNLTSRGYIFIALIQDVHAGIIRGTVSSIVLKSNPVIDLVK